MSGAPSPSVAPMRRPAVAGSFYPADPGALSRLVKGLLESAGSPEDMVAAMGTGLAGILVPHAGLEYSGSVAAAAWRLLAAGPGTTSSAAARARPTLVLLGTNHSAGWLHGVGIWGSGTWRTPLGDVGVDEDLAAGIAAIGWPFTVDRDAHRSEHSLEVQLPFVQAVLPDARIVPLAVATGTGDLALSAGERLGMLLKERRNLGAEVILAISTDMAHYPPAAVAAWITEELAPPILALEPVAVASAEATISRSGLPGVACGMCGIEPTVVGLAAIRAMGAEHGVQLAAATSADVGGPSHRTVAYLAAAFPAGD